MLQANTQQYMSMSTVDIVTRYADRIHQRAHKRPKCESLRSHYSPFPFPVPLRSAGPYTVREGEEEDFL